MQKLRMQLAGTKKQMDDPADATRLEREIADAASELEKSNSPSIFIVQSGILEYPWEPNVE
ncbi:MAG TPA: hypothetical protein VND64_30745 [Pirellulales bacterium]|nr:hypothetical protein [Pirellulales bacterium]